MNHIRQSKENSCLAAVLAMITGQTEKYVLDWFKYIDTPYCDEDAFIFLAHHGIYLSFNATIRDGYRMNGREIINVDLDMRGRAAYIVVKSETFKGKNHAIFFDGYNVYDPKEEKPNTKSLEDYEIDCFYPMMRTSERDKIFNKWSETNS